MSTLKGFGTTPVCSMQLKKNSRTLIEEIVVDVHEQQLSFIIHWKGACHATFKMDRPRSAAKGHKTLVGDIDLIRKMACYDDGKIAQVLCRLGRKTGKGNAWKKRHVAYIRKKYSIEYKKQNPGILSLRRSMLAHNGIGGDVDGKSMGEVQQTVFNPLPAVFKAFTGDSVVAT